MSRHLMDSTHAACMHVWTVQVHAAVLRGSNKEVVLKVLKPGVADILTTGEPEFHVCAGGRTCLQHGTLSPPWGNSTAALACAQK